MKPFPVAHVAGARDVSDNLTINWVRRSRGIVRILDSAPLPLYDTTEAYEVDVMNGGSVVRTISVTSPTASYSAAEQTTDFGSTQSSLTVKIYQLSTQYGRGYVKDATI